LGDQDNVGKTTSETEQAMTAYLGGDDDDDDQPTVPWNIVLLD
jgi:hypothetical protein